jgi:hypothetical protein
MADRRSTLSASAGTGRRRFLGACGVIGAAALPCAAAGAAILAPSAGLAGWSWADFRTGLIPSLQAAYLAELERFAETLRPRFESGELRAFRDGDENAAGTSPQWEVERLCAVHFGLQVTKSENASGWEQYDGDAATAHAILAASPHAEYTADVVYYHPADHATSSAAWDVIALARARGWYVPTPDECEDPALEIA